MDTCRWEPPGLPRFQGWKGRSNTWISEQCIALVDLGSLHLQGWRWITPLVDLSQSDVKLLPKSIHLKCRLRTYPSTPQTPSTVFIQIDVFRGEASGMIEEELMHPQMHILNDDRLGAPVE